MAASPVGAASAAGSAGSVSAGLEAPSDSLGASAAVRASVGPETSAWPTVASGVVSTCDSSGREASGGLPAGVSLLIRWPPWWSDSIEAPRPRSGLQPVVRPAAEPDPTPRLAAMAALQALPRSSAPAGCSGSHPASPFAGVVVATLRQAPMEGARLPATLDLPACSCSPATTPSWVSC